MLSHPCSPTLVWCLFCFEEFHAVAEDIHYVVRNSLCSLGWSPTHGNPPASISKCWDHKREAIIYIFKLKNNFLSLGEKQHSRQAENLNSCQEEGDKEEERKPCLLQQKSAGQLHDRRML